MKKVQKNSFEKMCDRLEENFVLNENEIKYSTFPPVNLV